MGLPPDENLPEVVPDSSPQVLTGAEAYQRYGKDEGNAKFVVVYESDATTPKYYYDPNEAAFASAAAKTGTPTSPSPSYPATTTPTVAYEDPAGGTDPESGRATQRICGLRKKVFLIVLALAIVVLVAAIGGGVGGAAAAKRRSNASAEAAVVGGGARREGDSDSDPPSAEDSSETVTVGGGAATATVTISTVPTTFATTPGASEPTSDPSPGVDGGGGAAEPGFEMVAWSEDDFQGRSIELTRVGFVNLPFNSTSYKWHPNGAGCCVTFCIGTSKSVGWRCTDFERKQATSNFDRLFFGCGADASEENSRCDR